MHETTSPSINPCQTKEGPLYLKEEKNYHYGVPNNNGCVEVDSSMEWYGWGKEGGR